MAETSIEWTDVVWNPTTGCDRISPGCDHCYALTMAKRLKGMGQAKYQTDGDPRTSGPGFGLAVHADALTVPLGWRQPKRVFVNSMSDLFHARVPSKFIALVFATMAVTPQHTYQILTKRPDRAARILSDYRWWLDVVVAAMDLGDSGPTQTQDDGCALLNVWIGTSVENQKYADVRLPDLRAVPAALRFLSFEPMLGRVTRLDLDGIGWVIAGGESGPGARPMRTDWVRSLRDQCTAAGVPFFFKQHGNWRPGGDAARAVSWVLTDGSIDQTGFGPEIPGALPMVNVGKKAAGRVLDGRTWDEYPQAVTHA